ncbi:hypothetical protein D3C72_2103920 [compost metagenome]
MLNAWQINGLKRLIDIEAWFAIEFLPEQQVLAHTQGRLHCILVTEIVARCANGKRGSLFKQLDCAIFRRKKTTYDSQHR